MSDHTPAPWPAPDTQLYAWGGKQESVLKGGVLSMADYLHAMKCVNERDELVAALRTWLYAYDGHALQCHNAKQFTVSEVDATRAILRRLSPSA